MKIAGPMGVDSFMSNISMTFQNNVSERFGDDDMQFNVDGVEGIAGTIAKYENQTGNSSTFGITKNHTDTKIRILLGIHRYITKHELDVKHVSLVVGQPIKMHVETEKNAIINMLQGEHNVTVNDVNMLITIDEVGVVPEGSSAFWSTEQDDEGEVHILDIGSGTINAATMIDQRHINTKSNTFPFGMETMKGSKIEQVANEIVRSSTSLGWEKDATVLVCGGSAEVLLPYIQTYYKNADIIYPVITEDRSPIVLHPMYANAVGYYNIGRGAYK
jgi:plasmid segregation protein ParM